MRNMKPETLSPDDMYRARKATSARVAKALKGRTVYALADILKASDDAVTRWATGTGYPSYARCSEINAALDKLGEKS